MCGLIGIAARSPVNDRDWLSRGRDRLAHRGPDDAGEWWSADSCVGLAHRRLSIIDLTPAGHQPMLSNDGTCCVVHNGEIYNFGDLRAELEREGFVFRSKSDTEVILAAYQHWGADCVERFYGMFAFAVYDARRQLVFLARDRAGEKPLYYSCTGRELRFASELKGLMADDSFSRNIDFDALDCYLAFGYVPGDMCILAGAAKLPPAHTLLYDLRNGESELRRYWQAPECAAAVSDDAGQVQQLAGRLEDCLERAVRRQLVADVPVGVLLSGGVDSSLVTALAARATPRIKTFSVRFPGYGDFDETPHARLIADYFATDHIELEASDVAPDALYQLARTFDEPMADSSMVPTWLISRVVRQHCKVVLGGDGGDELFGGYGRYNRLLGLQRRFGALPRVLRGAFGVAASTFLPPGFKGRNWMRQFAADLKNDMPPDGVHFDRRTRRALLGGSAADGFAAEDVWARRTPDEEDVIQRATRMDFENYLPEKILVKVDRASMDHSLEVRAPYLDPDVVDFAFADVPPALKATTSRRKILPAALASKVLPGGFDVERKQGFSIPLASWLRAGAWRDFFHDVLTDSASDMFDRATVDNLLRGQQKGRSNSERLFSLVLFELWRREYGA